VISDKGQTPSLEMIMVIINKTQIAKRPLFFKYFKSTQGTSPYNSK
jgi:hypothetical protein